jgi:hypothetical protein
MLNLLLSYEKRGRAVNGLVQMGRMVVSALGGDVQSAVVARDQMARLWEATMPALNRAHGEAVTARVLPADHPVAVEAARSAEAFFTTNGFRAALDLYSDVFARYREEAGEIAV